MARQSRRLDRMRIASPCSAGWEQMPGDDRVRFCNQCNLNVYNISAMTAGQVQTLINRTEGRFCARLYRRRDGTIMTQDCPVGLRAIRRRVSRIAGAAITTLMSFCFSVFGQDPAPGVCTQDSGKLLTKIKKTQNESQDNRASISGTIIDPQGARVPGARLTLINDKTEEEQVSSSTDEGKFQYLSLAAGTYTLKIEMVGFKTTKVISVVAKSNEVNSFNVTLEVADEFEGELMGVVDYSHVDLSTTSVTTNITDRVFSRLPLP